MALWVNWYHRHLYRSCREYRWGEAFTLEAVDYLLKPFAPERVDSIVG